MNDEVTTENLRDLILHYSADGLPRLFPKTSRFISVFTAFSTTHLVLFCSATGTYTTD